MTNHLSPSAAQTSAEWLDTLQANGYRLTRPLNAIIEVMASSHSALSPLQVYDLGRLKFPRLGLVTVYRALEKLEELKLVQRVHQPDGCHRYLHAARGHQHLLVCTVCGRAEYFSGDDFTNFSEHLAASSGYQIHDHWLQYFGLCPACQAKSENET
jgi:Fe2+ or Zn2+ uptake regulation protein